MTEVPLNIPHEVVEQPEEWPDPVPLPCTLPAVPTFEPSLLPTELRAWISDIAERMQCPLDFVAIPAMIAIGSLIGSKVGIRPEANTDWTEVGNLWGCVVGSPGTLKSPALREVLNPIRQLEESAQRAFQSAQAEYEQSMKLFKIQQDLAEKKVRKQLEEDENESMARAVLGAVQEPERPQDLRYLMTDATVEKLGMICSDNPAGLLVHRDELVTLFADLDKEEKAAARSFYLSGWNGRERYAFDRVGRGKLIISVTLSMLGTVQPNRLANYMRQSIMKHDDGMVQRLQLLTWPDFPKDWKPTDRHPDTEARQLAYRCFEKLAKLDPSQIGGRLDESIAGNGVPFLRFSPDARIAFEQWRSMLETKVRDRDAYGPLSAHLSKYRGLIPRLALICHLASGENGPVSLKACEMALAWGTYLEAHARRAYASLTSANGDIAQAIWRRIEKGELANRFTERDIYRHGWSNLKDKDVVSAGLKLLYEYDWIGQERISTGGRPSMIWTVNPKARK